MEEGYALKLNRDAQVNMLNAAVPLMPEGSRVVFVTSHQAHFINTVPTMPEYEPVARSKRAGEDALRELVPNLAEKGISLVVVSGDMIEGTVTATLLDRSNPGAIEARRAEAGKLYSVEEFAAESPRWPRPTSSPATRNTSAARTTSARAPDVELQLGSRHARGAREGTSRQCSTEHCRELPLVG